MEKFGLFKLLQTNFTPDPDAFFKNLASSKQENEKKQTAEKETNPTVTKTETPRQAAEENEWRKEVYGNFLEKQKRLSKMIDSRRK